MDWDAIKSKANALKDKTIEGSKTLANKAKGASINAYDKAKEAIGKTKEAGQDAVDASKEKITETKERGEHVIESAKEKGEALKEKVADTVEKASDKAGSVVEKGKTIVEKAKEMGAKAMDGTTSMLGKTAPMVKIMADYEKIKEDKILVILFLEKQGEESKKLQLSMPIIMKDSWISGTTFKVCDIEDSKDVAEHFKVTDAPTLIAWEQGKQVLRTEDVNVMRKYLKDYAVPGEDVQNNGDSESDA